jgi:hypothetical protein
MLRVLPVHVKAIGAPLARAVINATLQLSNGKQFPRGSRPDSIPVQIYIDICTGTRCNVERFMPRECR